MLIVIGGEEFLRSDFVKMEAGQPSLLLPGKMQAPRESFKCPSCEEPGKPPEHGIEGSCKCGLNWISYGNRLKLWRAY
jgi:hypothetical protein